MKKISLILTVLVISSFTFGGESKPKEPLANHLQAIAVTIHASSGGRGYNQTEANSLLIRYNEERGTVQGSGTLVTRGDTTYILTCGHVIEGLRKERTVVDPTAGTKKTLIEYDDAKIVQEYRENGRSVGRIELDCEVIRYSDAEDGEDLALLRVRKKKFSTVSAKFWLDKGIPPLLTKLVHCGSLHGQVGSNSLTTGVLSQIGRLHKKVIYDQTTVPAMPGSSGGLVCTEEGLFMGMILRGSGETFNLIAPIRRIKDWAKRAKISFVLDPSIPAPSADELKKSAPVDDVKALGGAKK